VSKTTETDPAEQLLLFEDEKVVSFKMEMMIAIGIDVDLAERIALDRSIDWHRAIDIMQATKDEKLVKRILL
jgi:hypothetical protein